VQEGFQTRGLGRGKGDKKLETRGDRERVVTRGLQSLVSGGEVTGPWFVSYPTAPDETNPSQTL